jgi:hypothetical protein
LSIEEDLASHFRSWNEQWSFPGKKRTGEIWESGNNINGCKSTCPETGPRASM